MFKVNHQLALPFYPPVRRIYLQFSDFQTISLCVVVLQPFQGTPPANALYPQTQHTSMAHHISADFVSQDKIPDAAKPGLHGHIAKPSNTRSKTTDSKNYCNYETWFTELQYNS